MGKRKRLLTDGSIRQRSNGRFEGRLYSNGKYISCYASTWDDCFDKLQYLIEERDRYKNNLRLFDWLDRFVELYKKPNVSKEWYKALKGYIKNYFRCNNPKIKPKVKLKNKPLPEIKGDELQEFLLGIEITRTRENVKMFLGGAMEMAFNLGYIDRNPMKATHIPKHKRLPGHYIDEKTKAEFYENLKSHNFKDKRTYDLLVLYYEFMFLTGCRRSEGLKAVKEDFNFATGTHHIRGTKTEHSDRIIPIMPGVEKIVNSIYSEGLLFDFKPDFVSALFSTYCPGHQLKDTRKTFAMNCRRCGVPLEVVQDWLGHTEIETTRKHYVDVLPEIHRQSVELLKSVPISYPYLENPNFS